MRAALDVGEGEQVSMVISFGYPARPRAPERRPVERWVEAADRVSHDEAVTVL
jgi:hypothetical protein